MHSECETVNANAVPPAPGCCSRNPSDLTTGTELTASSESSRFVRPASMLGPDSGEHLREMRAFDGAASQSSACKVGFGNLRVVRNGHRSSISRSVARAPLKLFVPPRQVETPRVYMSSYGGGLLAGDQTHLTVHLDPGTRCVLSSQASTKIYRNPDRLPCSQTIDAKVGEDAILVVAPESISPFAESQYLQSQNFEIAEGGNLVLIDWMTSGRYECGERFQFRSYESRQSIRYGGRRILEDNMRLEPGQIPLDSTFRMGAFNCIGLMVVLGPQFVPLTERLLNEESVRKLGQRDGTMVVSQSIRQGTLTRVLSFETQPARILFESWLRCVDPVIRTKTWLGKL